MTNVQPHMGDLGEKKRRTVTLPELVWERLAEVANRERRPLSAQLETLLITALDDDAKTRPFSG